MKCPKCNYLGFDTGDRCKHCGYDFSLIDLSSPDEVEVDLDLTFRAPDPSPTSAAVPEQVLPLFTPDDADDTPLVKLPATPRAPLAVRKTPEIARLRAVPRPAPRLAVEPVLEFPEPAVVEEPAPPPRRERPSTDRVAYQPGAAGARLAAAALDHLILAGIDVAVVYLTLRMAELSTADWSVLPLAPLATFLLLLKVSYFCAFTAIGGQTIGKMAMGIRVLTDEGAPVDSARAIRRTLAGTISAVVLGLGFLPALRGDERRALHDHLARTRVVDLHSA